MPPRVTSKLTVYACQSVSIRSVFWLNDRTAKVSDQVNRKCPLETRIDIFRPHAPSQTPSPQITQLLEHRGWCLLANILKHTVNKRTAKMSTSVIAIVTSACCILQATLAVHWLFLSNSWATSKVVMSLLPVCELGAYIWAGSPMIATDQVAARWCMLLPASLATLGSSMAVCRVYCMTSWAPLVRRHWPLTIQARRADVSTS